MRLVHSLSDQKKFFGTWLYIIKELSLLFMSVLPREIYHPGPFPWSEMRNGQNRDSGNRGTGCSGGLRSLRNDPREYPSRFRVPQNDRSSSNPNSGNRKPWFSEFLIQLWRIGLGEVVLLTPTPFGASMPCRAGSSKKPPPFGVTSGAKGGFLKWNGTDCCYFFGKS